MNEWTTSIALTSLVSPLVGILLSSLFVGAKRNSLQIFGQMTTAWSLIGWLVIGGFFFFQTGEFEFALAVDYLSVELSPLALAWLIATSFFWAVSFSSHRSISFGSSTVQLLTLAFIQLAIVTSHSGLQWGLVAMTSWLAMSQSSMKAEKVNEADWSWIVADFIWLAALLNVTFVLGTMQIESLCDLETLRNLPPPQTTFVVTGAYGLMFSLAFRCALFPMSSLVRSDVSPIASYCHLGLGAYLLLQYHPLLTAFSETRSLMAGLGVLSALLLPAVGLSETNRQRKIFRVATATIAMMWVAAACAPQRIDILVKLGACTLIVSSLVFVQLSKSLQWIVAALFACGICGQEWCLGAVRYASAQAADVQIPEAFVVIILLGHALNCYLLCTLSKDDSEENIARPTLHFLPILGIALIVLSQGLPVWGWQRSWSVQLGTLVIVSILAATIYGVYHQALAATLSRRGKAIVRLSQTQFYGDAFFWIFSVPIQILSYSVLALNVSKDFLFSNLREMTKTTAELTTQMDDESSNSFAIISVTIFVLSIGWAISVWL